MTARRCTSTDTDRGFCNAYALADSDPPLCHFHSMTPEERKAWTAKGGRARKQAQRVRADQEERLDGIAFGIAPEHVLGVCRDALDAKLVTGEPDWGARLSACAVLLQCFPRTLRTTPEEAQAILHELLDGTRHKALAERAVREMYRAQRAEWFDTMTRCDALGNLYVVAIPPMLFGPGDTPSSVRHEVPEFEGWKSEPLHDDSGRDIGYSRVTRPDGTNVLVERDRGIRERDAA